MARKIRKVVTASQTPETRLFEVDESTVVKWTKVHTVIIPYHPCACYDVSNKSQFPTFM